METKNNYSNRTIFIIAVICLLQLTAFITITIVENQKREILVSKLELKRKAITNISISCTGLLVRKIKEYAPDMKTELHRQLRHELLSRQNSQEINGLVQSQENLLLKTCTNDTKICLKGLKGDTGLPGQKGTPGLKGENGSKGLPGFSGKDGIKGITGAQGPPGTHGAKGVKGSAGLVGNQGTKGEMGDQGEKGEAGRPGIVGEKGDTGAVGRKGQRGINGPAGQKGGRGLKGEPGIAGSKGDVGEAGQDGNTPKLNQTKCDCYKQTGFVDSRTVITAPLGSEVTLNCTTSPPQLVRWTRNHSNCYKPIYNNAVINFQHLNPVDLGEYQCMATDGFNQPIQKTIYVNSTDKRDGVSCDFESGSCSLQLTDWKITNKTYDHTTGTSRGNYITMNGINNKITSLWIDGGKTQCLSFWYKTTTTGTQPSSTLNVKTVVNDCLRNRTSISKSIKETKSTQSTWTQEYVQLPTNQASMQIVLEAQTSNMAISIDDIQLTSGECPKAQFGFYDPKNITLFVPKGGNVDVNCSSPVQTGQQFTVSKPGTCHQVKNLAVTHITNAKFSDAGQYVCELIKDGHKTEKIVNIVVTGETTCHFEKGLCGWTQNTNTDNMDWITQSMNTPSVNTGPNSDNTFRNSSGRYLFIEASGQQAGNKAVLESPVLSSSSYCLSLAYHMYGSNIGTLKIYTEECNNPTISKTIWSSSGDSGQSWQTKCLEVPERAKDYQIFIEASVGSGFRSDIAIDDVSYSPKNSTGTCTCQLDTTFSDFCDFESGFCNWHQGQSDDFDWYLLSGPTDSTGTGPNGDHTTGSGKYIYTEASRPRQTGDKAELLSNYLKAGVQYCLTIYYNMYGSTMGTLDIYRETSGSTSTRYKLFAISGDRGSLWHKQQVNITPTTSNFRIVISGTIGSDYYSDMALDDITITTGTCA